MDARRLDTLVRLLGSAADRRTALGALAAGVSAALAMTQPFPAEGKAKKCKRPNTKCGKKGCCQAGSQVCANGKCAAACQFTKTATTWTLKGNCTTTKTITIPDGVTLDGNGKTIRLAGEGPAGIANASGAEAINVRNLTIDGSAASGGCPGNAVFGIGLGNAGGELKNVTITNIPCASAITAGGSKHLDILDSTIQNNGVSGDGAISLSDGMDVTITNCAFLDIEEGFGVRTQAGATKAMIKDSTFSNVFVGGFLEQGSITADNNTLAVIGAGFVGNGGDTLAVTNCTIVGPGTTSSAPQPFGVGYSSGTGGSVSGNTISNFLDLGTAATSCGIHIDADAGAVTLGANTFPNPPGNEQNVCDLRE